MKNGFVSFIPKQMCFLCSLLPEHFCVLTVLSVSESVDSYREFFQPCFLVDSVHPSIAAKYRPPKASLWRYTLIK